MTEVDKVLSLLSMARRAGELLIGQDKIFDAIRRKKKLVVLVTEDCSANVMRTLNAAAERGDIKIFKIEGTERTALGERIGTASAQAAALPEQSGFSARIISMIKDRSDADE